ncbi:MAG TPA: hypothetical protein VMW91_04765, partial [Desulfosporosinus sp.]|nr:hypothetical protein [Desulfosporosinus sp.]
DLSMDGLMSRCHGWQGATHMQNPEVMRFSRSMKGTLTQDVSSASSAKDGDRRGERWNVCERAKTLPLDGTCTSGLRYFLPTGTYANGLKNFL